MCKLKLSEAENKKSKYRFRRASRITGLVVRSTIVIGLNETNAINKNCSNDKLYDVEICFSNQVLKQITLIFVGKTCCEQ